MLNDPTAGLGFLQDIDGLFIQERVEFLEAFTGCDTKNVYHITPIQRGALPDPTGQMPPEWIERFTRQANFYPLLKAKEESQCAERVCCPLFRSFEMDFKDGAGAVFFSLRRPYRCTVHTPCFMCAPQELALLDAHGAAAAAAREEFRAGWCCARSFVAAGGGDSAKYESEDYYRVRTSECGTSSGNNCCAPSCFNASYDLDVFDAGERSVVARAANVWPGCNCAGRDGPLEHHPAVSPGRGPETTRGARRGDHAGGVRALRVAQGGQRGGGAHADLTSIAIFCFRRGT
jgi:hypothetical protein